MALFIQKPILWNTKGYKGPSGYPVTAKSWPLDHGYGQEEWNNDPRMVLKHKHGDLRFFHTERIEVGGELEYAGQTFIFMMVSYGGRQFFVGIAGNATYLGAEGFKKQRIEIGRRLNLNILKEETWDLDRVREIYCDKHKSFLRDWKSNLQWITNWVCPDSHYWWFDTPIEISSKKVRGTQRWLSMFGSYTKLTDLNAIDMMNLIPIKNRTAKWDVLHDAMASATEITNSFDNKIKGDEDDADEIFSKMSIVEARLGQGRYRAALMGEWEGKCALTGIECTEMLLASHIKPWSACKTKREKLDVANGLLLSANVDALFDRFLISFEDDGSLLVSPKLPGETIKLSGLDRFTKLRKKPLPASATYLKYHRDCFSRHSL